MRWLKAKIGVLGSCLFRKKNECIGVQGRGGLEVGIQRGKDELITQGCSCVGVQTGEVDTGRCYDDGAAIFVEPVCRVWP